MVSAAAANGGIECLLMVKFDCLLLRHTKTFNVTFCCIILSNLFLSRSRLLWCCKCDTINPASVDEKLTTSHNNKITLGYFHYSPDPTYMSRFITTTASQSVIPGAAEELTHLDHNKILQVHYLALPLLSFSLQILVPLSFPMTTVLFH